MKIPFVPADILLPKTVDSRWPVVACDQFTSQPEYWQEAERIVGNAPSTLNMILPEVYLNDTADKRIEKINRTIAEYLASDLFDEYKDAMIYVERTLPDGKIRHGLVGAVDLEAYDFTARSTLPVRATEGTVLSRIPPRVEIRKDAPVELPHVMLLADDKNRIVIEPLADRKQELRKLYDVELMLGGGRIAGYLLDDAAKAQVNSAMEKLAENCCGFLFAVGDGNHSLATAKTCYENAPNDKNRYALCELTNLHDESLEFEPIYRVMFGVDPEDVVKEAGEYFGKLTYTDSSEDGYCNIEYIYGNTTGKLKVAIPLNALPVGLLQDFIDNYILDHPEVEVDYIHGEDVTRRLAAGENAVGFVFPGMPKNILFGVVDHMGSLPRKTFSMGEAASKRYYMECRRIK